MTRTGRTDRRGRRAVVASIGAILILAAGLYGPVTLLPPLPIATARVLDLPAPAEAGPPAVVLPTDGASAVVSTGAATPFGTAGTTEPVPIAGASKIVAALVALDEHPLDAGRSGDNIPITADDYASYLRYRDAGGRTIPVVEGDTWTQREVLQAVVLGSSNNHVDTLARWAFGSLDGYVRAAEGWLAEHGLGGTTIVDPTGLDGGNTGTAADLARIAALAVENAVLGELLRTPTVVTSRGYEIENQAAFLVDDGVRGISRSFTDAAGVCFLFSVPLGDSGEGSGDEQDGLSTTVYGAFLRQPSYDSLSADVTAFLDGVRQRAGAVRLVAAGTEVAEYRTAWGQRTTAVVRDDVTAVILSGASPVGEVRTDRLRTVTPGDRVGTMRFEVDGEVSEVVLEASSALTDPGPGWRLLAPGPMIGSLLAELGRVG